MSAKVDDDFIVIERHVVGKYEFIGVIPKEGNSDDVRKFLVAVDGRVLRVLYGTLESAMAGVAISSGTVFPASEQLPPTDGGPAFPIPSEPGIMAGANGMSLEDWFAGQALSGLAAFPGRAEEVLKPEHFARWSYAVARAMLQERKR